MRRGIDLYISRPIPKMASYSYTASFMARCLEKAIKSKILNISRVPAGCRLEAKNFFKELGSLLGPTPLSGMQREMEIIRNKKYNIARYVMAELYTKIEEGVFEKALKRMMTFMENIEAHRELNAENLEIAIVLHAFFAKISEIGASEGYEQMMRRSHAALDGLDE
jgi:hypothetical protein